MCTCIGLGDNPLILSYSCSTSHLIKIVYVLIMYLLFCLSNAIIFKVSLAYVHLPLRG